MNLITLFTLTDHHERLLQILQEFSGIDTSYTGIVEVEKVPEVLQDSLTSPTSYRLFRNKEWVIVEINSVVKLHALAQLVSHTLNTIFLQVIYCESVEYAYLLFYDRGQLRREIEARGHKLLPDLNIGQPFEFEELPVEYFDLDLLAYYCGQWKIDLSNLYTTDICTILERTSPGPMVCMDYIPAMEKLLLTNTPNTF